MSHLERLINIFYRSILEVEKRDKFRKSVATLIFTDTCIGCGACFRICPGQAIGIFDEGSTRKIYYHRDSCARCLSCLRICQWDGIDKARFLSGEYIKGEFTALELARCKVCNEILSTKRGLEWLKMQGGTFEINTLCPGCRRRETARGYILVPEGVRVTAGPGR